MKMDSSRLALLAVFSLALVLSLARVASAGSVYTCATVRISSAHGAFTTLTGLYTSMSLPQRADGALFYAQPTDACQTVTRHNTSWIALVDNCAGDACAVDTKMRNIVAAGAKGIIFVGCDATRDIPLILTVSFSQTPSVALSGASGSTIRDLLSASGDDYRASFESDSSCDQQKVTSPTWLLYTGVVLLIICIGSLLAVAFYFIYRRRYLRARRVRIVVQKRPSPALLDAVRRIPTFTVGTESDTERGYAADSCAVCLDDYEAGQIARILPCKHCFHVDCVDRWLISHGTCPLCKAEVMRALLGDAEMWTTVIESAGDNGNADPAAAQAVAVLQEAGLLHIDLEASRFGRLGLQHAPSAILAAVPSDVIAAAAAAQAGGEAVEMVDLSPEARRRRAEDIRGGNAWGEGSSAGGSGSRVSPRVSAVSDVSDVNLPRASVVGVEDDSDLDVEIIGEIRVVEHSSQ